MCREFIINLVKRKGTLFELMYQEHPEKRDFYTVFYAKAKSTHQQDQQQTTSADPAIDADAYVKDSMKA